MSSSFLLRKQPKETKKRKPQTVAGPKNTSRKSAAATGSSNKIRRRHATDDDEIQSDDDEYESGIDTYNDKSAAHLEFSSDDGDVETPQDKRLRLAKEYLQKVEEQEVQRADDREVFDHVSHRLQTEYLDSVGRLRRNIAASIVGYEESPQNTLKHNKQKLSVCSLVLSGDGKFLFTGAKTQYVLKWNLEEHRIDGCIDVRPHAEDRNKGIKRRSHVIAMCLSSDMKFLALSDGGHNIQIWCPQQLKHMKTFKGHRDTVTALVFRKDTHDLYSGGRDRSVKIWTLDEMAYVESLFGHQAGVTGIDALNRERAITSGGSDCSLRIWKITEESQLVYNGHRGSIECVKFINDEHFVSGGDDGSICLWSALKKKPVCTENVVHGLQACNSTANWITALACVVNTDLIASGSCDGFIRLWQSTDNARKLNKILEIPVTGFINGLTFNAEGTRLFVAVGQEHRLGRWWRIKEAKNKIVIFDLLRNKDKENS